MQTNNLILQVTDKTRADIKGGTLIQYEGKVIFPKLNIYMFTYVNIYIRENRGESIYNI